MCVRARIFGVAVAVDRGEGVALKLPHAWVEGEQRKGRSVLLTGAVAFLLMKLTRIECSSGRLSLIETTTKFRVYDMIHGGVNKTAQRVKQLEKSFLKRLVIIVEQSFYFFRFLPEFSQLLSVSIRATRRNVTQRRSHSSRGSIELPRFSINDQIVSELSKVQAEQ